MWFQETAASIIGLAGAALSLVQEIQNAVEQMKAVPGKVKDAFKRLERLVQACNLIKEEARLQTNVVKQQLDAIVEDATLLRDFANKLRDYQVKNIIRRFMHALISGKQDDEQLSELLGNLDRDRGELTSLMSVTLVGLVGSLQNGFRVSLSELAEVNNRFKAALGEEMQLVGRLKGRAQQDGT